MKHLGVAAAGLALLIPAPAHAGVHGSLTGTGHVSPDEFRAATYGTAKWRVQRGWHSVGKLMYQWEQFGHPWREKRYQSTVTGAWVEAYYRQDDAGVWRLQPDLQWCTTKGCGDAP